ncbi:MAG: hypothetical protein LBS00_04125 [Synergistaceae bacterium]|nr:hypothetical protein [Synergistaceae bacterium]
MPIKAKVVVIIISIVTLITVRPSAGPTTGLWLWNPPYEGYMGVYMVWA